MQDNPLSRLIMMQRQDLGLSQAELGARADLAQSTVSRIESGKTVLLSAAVKRKLAAALGLRFGDLTRASLAQADPRVTFGMLEANVEVSLIFSRLSQEARELALSQLRVLERWDALREQPEDSEENELGQES
jgi:transcriptional regulator with XRE-family HTH domain